MTETKVTRHQCPICKEIIYNNVATFHDHLNKVCAQTLFSKYPALLTEKFNALWYKLADMVKESIIVPSGQKGVPATIQPAQPQPQAQAQAQPPYHNNYQAQHPHQAQRRRMDLEDLDRDISYLQKTEKERQKNRVLERKRRRYEMEQEISSELNQDSFTLSMPNLDDQENPKHKKRRLLYHNTSDIRPPKRVNIDPAISIDLFQNKIRETRRSYHNVSMEDFTNTESDINVDQHPAIIHTQKALSRYLSHCEMLRKCFNAELFEKLAKKAEKVYGVNYSNAMMSTLQEINVWDTFEENQEQQIKDDIKEKEEKEDFLSSWDAIQHQTSKHHLDKLLERESLCGFYANIDTDHSETDPKNKHTFWNASNNLKHVGYHHSMFDNAQNKKYIKL